MPGSKNLRTFILVAIFLGIITFPRIPLNAFIVTINAPPVLSIIDDTGGFLLLSFDGFSPGSETNVGVVNYTIQSNTMATGTVADALSARLSGPFTDIEFKASAGSFTNAGTPDFSSLQSTSAGFITIGIADVALASKQPGTGDGDVLLDGTITVNYKAVLSTDHAAGIENQSLIVTLKDGQ
ncbi:MAG: hypothetical protein HZC17_09700 [Candidatus Omnitrophica bacterium]|nr:hypothetical protein [Candidatus Omnitrophota bacterium]